MRRRLVRIASDPMARNAAALYGLQIADYVVPMATLSYLARVLGPEAWGAVLYAQGFALWLTLLFEYGFQLSTTRESARGREDRKRVAEIVAGVAGASVLLTAASLAAAGAAQLAIAAFRERPLYLWLAWGIAFTGGVRPLWYYQGLERLGWPSLWNGISRVAVAAALFVFVRSADDAYWVLVLQVIASGAVLVAMWQRLYKEIPFRAPDAAAAF
ncbi:MAG: oligosaccharide flippase family protein, partial [Bryobacteraceae bacterium]